MSNTIPRVYSTAVCDRQLRALRRGDGKAAAAAERADSIFAMLIRSRAGAWELSNKLTKNGELRLQNCSKYDLGSGYRLVAVKKEFGLCFVFAGSHDACDRWLDKRRETGLILHLEKLRQILLPAKKNLPPIPLGELVEAEKEYEARLASKLDDDTLRRLFRGLSGGNQ